MRVATYLREIVITVLAIVNVVLIYQNVELRIRLSVGDQPAYLKAGDVIPPIAVRDLDGELSSLKYAGEATDTILLFLSPSCPFCEALFPTWQQAIVAARQRGLRVVILARESEDPDALIGYLERWDVSFLETFFISEEARLEYGLYGTPVTMVIGSEGVVANSWIGLWGPAERTAASDYFGVDFMEHATAKGPEGKNSSVAQ